VTERVDLLPTMMDEVSVELRVQTEVKLLASKVVWLEDGVCDPIGDRWESQGHDAERVGQ
jgi:hypothetical protein